MDKNDMTTESEVKEALIDYNRLYTYSDYMTWDDDVRRELIDGVVYLMSAPNRQHQGLLGNLHGLLWNFLRGKHCKVYPAAFDVRLNADTLDNTVVQPDIVVICDHSKLDAAGCKGAPDMVVEILSPSTSRYDRTLKFSTYLKAGIREYWIIDPVARSVAVNLLKEGDYITRAYTEDEVVPVSVLDGCSIVLSEVFEE